MSHVLDFVPRLSAVFPQSGRVGLFLPLHPIGQSRYSAKKKEGMTQPLTNYLRTHRKKSGLSLDELGFLVGHGSGSAAGKHERYRRIPTVSTVFAYEVVFRTPARDLFRGLYGSIERATIRRALELSKQLDDQRLGRHTLAKQEALKAIYLPITPDTHDDASS